MGIRKNFRDLTATERGRLVQALRHVKATGFVDQFASMHEMHFNMGIHKSSHFLPWHREMLVRFEHALQEHHPEVTIPYWNSSVDTSPSGPLWRNDFLGQFDGAWGLRRALGSDTLPTPAQVDAASKRTKYSLFWPDLEVTIHNPPHRWVGGVMAGAASPGDPVFYLHHCWIDLLWTRWQRRFPDAPFEPSRAGFGLNDPLMEWPDRTPAHVLNHHALGYIYDYEVPPRWESLGGVKTSGPAAVLQTGGRLAVFARGQDNTIWHRWQTTRNGHWSEWEDIGAPPGGATSRPAAALNAPGGMVAFVRGGDNAIWHNWQHRPDAQWSGWETLGGVKTSNPAAVLQTGGRLAVFARGQDNTIWHRWQTTRNGHWSEWEDIGAPPGGATSGPAAALNAPGGMVTFARGGDNAVWHAWQHQPDGQWSGWETLGGVLTVDPAAVLQTGGRLVVFARATDKAIWHRWQTTRNGEWVEQWDPIGAPSGGATSGPAAALNAPGGMVTFARGADNAIWQAWQDRPDGNWW